MKRTLPNIIYKFQSEGVGRKLGGMTSALIKQLPQNVRRTYWRRVSVLSRTERRWLRRILVVRAVRGRVFGRFISRKASLLAGYILEERRLMETRRARLNSYNVTFINESS